MTIHDRIKELRLSYGISQKELADELNLIEIESNDPKIFTQTISYWENGRDPHLNGLKKIARFFNCSVDFLLNESDIKNWSEFSVLSELSSKPIESFSSFLKDRFEEEVAMAIIDSFKWLMTTFTNLKNKEDNDATEWDSEVNDTINKIPILLKYSQEIHAFQGKAAYYVERYSDGEKGSPFSTSMKILLEIYQEFEDNVRQLNKKVFNNALLHPGTIAVDLFLSDKELQKRRDIVLEELKNSNPEAYDLLKQLEKTESNYRNEILNSSLQKPPIDMEWFKELEEIRKDSKLKRREK